ncbi:hypothetical protein I5M32_01405 [Pedobacter sp. SD-b]|uniref:Uncharacterized protein n=1 Tax=Pedobacter segetis TaxID=2793069 RepID=A0ABS1BFF8_9SPHI|nr:hypothetical protein [Pedobacter segetis]MBK0381604.1 hypothetical protein [Pedobacter segetis]
MTFQDRKNKGKDWEKTQEKRKELNDKNLEEANKPKSVYKQVNAELEEKNKKTV